MALINLPFLYILKSLIIKKNSEKNLFFVAMPMQKRAGSRSESRSGTGSESISETGSRIYVRNRTRTGTGSEFASESRSGTGSVIQ
jgi:hypothetical protein